MNAVSYLLLTMPPNACNSNFGGERPQYRKKEQVPIGVGSWQVPTGCQS